MKQQWAPDELRWGPSLAELPWGEAQPPPAGLHCPAPAPANLACMPLPHGMATLAVWL